MPISKDIIGKTLELRYGEAAYKIAERLMDAGFETWWVGGGVRDMLQGKIPTDIDIATAATPEQIRAILPKTEGGEETFGSTRVRIGSHLLEVTTFREDDEASDGRHPEAIVFGTREQDAHRRDFTINAIYWHSVSGDLYDPFKGEADLHERLIRFIGDPAVRIKHDALRLLRAIRFRARIDGQYHPETYRALQEQAALVEILSGSRQLEELEKMLKGPHPDRALEDLWELGILKYMIPELHACKGVPQPSDYHHEGDVWEHTLHCTRAFSLEDDPDVRLAALFHDAGKVETFSLKERIRFDRHASVSGALVSNVLKRMQVPRKRIEKIAWLIEHHMMMGSFAEMTEERKGHWYFHPWFSSLLRLFQLDIAGTDPSDYSLYEKIANDYDHFLDRHPRPAKPLLTGEDVMHVLGLKPGETIGKILQSLQEAQTQGTVTSKAEAKAWLHQFSPELKDQTL